MSEFLTSNDWQWRPGRCELSASLKRPHGLAVLLLVLDIARGRKRHGVGEQQDGVHVLPRRHGERAGEHHSELVDAGNIRIRPSAISSKSASMSSAC